MEEIHFFKSFDICLSELKMVKNETAEVEAGARLQLKFACKIGIFAILKVIHSLEIS